MNPDLDAAAHIAIRAARAAGELLLRGCDASEKHATAKGHPHNPVTDFDRRAEALILRIIMDGFPDHGILAEEAGRIEGPSNLQWIIDPLDGTNNFLRGLPHFAVSIALCNGKEVLVACAHDPVRRETFTAVRGGGAFVNDQRLSVSPHPTLDGAMIAVGFSYLPEQRGLTLSRLRRLTSRVCALRTSGSAVLDLAYVAAGRLDGAWHPALHEWDVAAGRLLLREAGGRLTDCRGGPLTDPTGGLVASNARIHELLLRAVGEEEHHG